MAVANKKPKARRRIVRFRKAGTNQKMLDLAEKMLATAQELFEDSGHLDTAVREVVADGIARIVHSGYDTKACATHLGSSGNVNEFAAYISANTAQWFRDRGFTEWYCVGAGSLFQVTHMPRFQLERTFGKKEAV